MPNIAYINISVIDKKETAITQGTKMKSVT
jgi:hypothetical protein